ncbi:hypothetical protein KSP39_PZI003858 [Platanthera zijinensis]|uniref:Myb-like domain-containing protein n=1 Tax=Platanthera zijinensis TaxID=2320716 RepID=A0AAP0BVV1_9ASPA
MLKDKVFLTYKRKRLSYQAGAAHDTKENCLSPNMQMGSSWMCIPKSEPDTNDEKLKNHHSGKFQCSDGISRYGFTESMHQHVPSSSEIIHCQMTSQKDMGPMVLRSRRVLSSTNIKNNSRLATSSTVNAAKCNVKDIIKMDVPDCGLDYITCAEGSLRDLTIHDRIGNTINLNVSLGTEGGDSFDCPEVGAKTISHSDNNGNALWNTGSSKEHSVAQLITFSRRAKMKQSANENMMDRNSKTAEKQHFSSRCSSHVVRDNLSCECSSQKCIFDEQLSRSSVVLEDYIVPSSQVQIAVQMANVKVDDASDCTAEVGTASKINQSLKNSEFLTAVDTCEEQSKELLSLQPVYTIKDDITPLNIVPSSSGNNAFSSSVEESGNKLILDTNNHEKRTITSLSEERDSPTGLDLSVAPISICQMSPETNKKSADLPENHRDSQSTSTPCCSFIFADDENDAKNKEMEWLESLENVLRERREDRGTCSSIVRDVIDHTERPSPIIPSRSTDQSVKVQDKAIDFINQFASLPPPHCPERKKAKSTPFTDFLGCFLPSNPHILLDLNTAPSSSGSNSRDKVSMLDMAFQHSSNGNSSFFKHKKAEKSITEMMLSRRRGLLSDKPRWYSSEWSEDELDFLWIGVRRHGADNWNAILGDPKLQFARSRFPKDLALQWEKEQKKLFNGIVIPPAILSKPSIPSTQSLDNCRAANARAFVENPMLTADTKLSLGGVHFHNESIVKNSQFGAACLPITTCPFPGNVLSMSLYPGAATRHKKASSASRTAYQLEYDCEKPLWERSRNEQKSACSNLPHWLKEANCSRPSDKLRPPFFTAGNAASFDIGLNSCEPLATSKDPRGRGILKRKRMMSEKYAGMVKIEEAPASIDESAAFCTKPSLESTHLRAPASEIPASCAGASSQKNIMVPPESFPVPDELVVLDSDASSEETISDDQNMRSYQDPEQVD